MPPKKKPTNPPGVPAGQKKGLCGHNFSAKDKHSTCPSCRSCTQQDRCLICDLWSDAMWRTYHSRGSYALRKARSEELRCDRESLHTNSPTHGGSESEREEEEESVHENESLGESTQNLLALVDTQPVVDSVEIPPSGVVVNRSPSPGPSGTQHPPQTHESSRTLPPCSPHTPPRSTPSVDKSALERSYTSKFSKQSLTKMAELAFRLLPRDQLEGLAGVRFVPPVPTRTVSSPRLIGQSALVNTSPDAAQVHTSPEAVSTSSKRRSDSLEPHSPLEGLPYKSQKLSSLPRPDRAATTGDDRYKNTQRSVRSATTRSGGDRDINTDSRHTSGLASASGDDRYKNTHVSRRDAYTGDRRRSPTPSRVSDRYRDVSPTRECPVDDLSDDRNRNDSHDRYTDNRKSSSDRNRYSSDDRNRNRNRNRNSPSGREEERVVTTRPSGDLGVTVAHTRGTRTSPSPVRRGTVRRANETLTTDNDTWSEDSYSRARRARSSSSDRRWKYEPEGDWRESAPSDDEMSDIEEVTLSTSRADTLRAMGKCKHGSRVVWKSKTSRRHISLLGRDFDERQKDVSGTDDEVPLSILPGLPEEGATAWIDELISGRKTSGPGAKGPLAKGFLKLPLRARGWRYQLDGQTGPYNTPDIPSELMDWIRENPTHSQISMKLLEKFDTASIAQRQALSYAELGYTSASFHYWKAVQRLESYIDSVERYIPKDKVRPDTKPLTKMADELALEASEAVAKSHRLAVFQSANARLARRDAYIGRLPASLPLSVKTGLRTSPMEIKLTDGGRLLFSRQDVVSAREEERKEMDRRFHREAHYTYTQAISRTQGGAGKGGQGQGKSGGQQSSGRGKSGGGGGAGRGRGQQRDDSQAPYRRNNRRDNQRSNDQQEQGSSFRRDDKPRDGKGRGRGGGGRGK